MNAHPFSIIKKNDRDCFYVSFKDKNGKYISPVSTCKKTKAEAIQAAYQMFYNGVPQKKTKAVTVDDLSLKSIIRELKTKNEVEVIQEELKRLGWVKKTILSETPQAEDFIQFLKTFWDWDTSPYIEEKLRQLHGIHRRHCCMQAKAVVKYWEPFFTGRYLGDINHADIEAFIKHMGKNNLSASRRNGVILAGNKALRWAYQRDMIEKDPTRGHILYTGEKRKRHILTPAAVAAVFRVEWNDNRAKLANMLAAVTGMRNGEILALRLQDIGSDSIFAGLSYNSLDKMKPTKNNEERTVEIPFPELIAGLFEQAKQNPWNVSPTSLVFWSNTRSKVPMDGRSFVWELRNALVKIGYTKEEAAKFDFHGWRHSVTGLNDNGHRRYPKNTVNISEQFTALFRELHNHPLYIKYITKVDDFIKDLTNFFSQKNSQYFYYNPKTNKKIIDFKNLFYPSILV